MAEKSFGRREWSHSKSLDEGNMLPEIKKVDTSFRKNFHIIWDLTTGPGSTNRNGNLKRDSQTQSIGDSYLADTMKQDMRGDEYFEKEDSMLGLDQS